MRAFRPLGISRKTVKATGVAVGAQEASGKHAAREVIAEFALANLRASVRAEMTVSTVTVSEFRLAYLRRLVGASVETNSCLHARSY